MSGCEYYQELISRMLDEDISRDERAALAEHLGTCRECVFRVVRHHFFRYGRSPGRAYG